MQFLRSSLNTMAWSPYERMTALKDRLQVVFPAKPAKFGINVWWVKESLRKMAVCRGQNYIGMFS